MVERGGGGREGGERGESDSRLLSITGRKDKNLLSLCQHSSAQRDFIDQRTAMQEPLLHPSDTIYHAPSSPPLLLLAFFSPHTGFHNAKRQKKTSFRKEGKKTASFWCKWSGAKCKTSDIPTRYNKWSPKATSWGLVVQHGLTPGQRGFFTLINHSSCLHRHI